MFVLPKNLIVKWSTKLHWIGDVWAVEQKPIGPVMTGKGYEKAIENTAG